MYNEPLCSMIGLAINVIFEVSALYANSNNREVPQHCNDYAKVDARDSHAL